MDFEAEMRHNSFAIFVEMGKYEMTVSFLNVLSSVCRTKRRVFDEAVAKDRTRENKSKAKFKQSRYDCFNYSYMKSRSCVHGKGCSAVT